MQQLEAANEADKGDMETLQFALDARRSDDAKGLEDVMAKRKEDLEAARALRVELARTQAAKELETTIAHLEKQRASEVALAAAWATGRASSRVRLRCARAASEAVRKEDELRARE